VIAGKIFIVFGRQEPFPAEIELDTLDGDDGFVVVGHYEGYAAGTSIAAAGDVNDDGIGDLIVGAPEDDDSPGWAYVIYGREDGFPAFLPVTSLDGSNGFALEGIGPESKAGRSVAGIGDVNGDGVDDIAIGAPYATRSDDIGAGEAYIVYGRASDVDADGVRDSLDNCTQAANADQRDTDGDGFGNACDPDLNGDCNVDFADLGLMRAVFFSPDADADLDGSGAVDFNDLGVLKQLFFDPPGPTGIVNVCDVVEFG
jgi:glycosylphosphatidylinositol phospholipase D